MKEYFLFYVILFKLPCFNESLHQLSIGLQAMNNFSPDILFFKIGKIKCWVCQLLILRKTEFANSIICLWHSVPGLKELYKRKVKKIELLASLYAVSLWTITNYRQSCWLTSDLRTPVELCSPHQLEHRSSD